jgi:small redox-active disulfide protein 2
MDVKILGSGCRNCQNLETNTARALRELGINATIGHVTDEVDIIGYGVMSTPALVIDDEVVLSGRVPTPEQLRVLIGARHSSS